MHNCICKHTHTQLHITVVCILRQREREREGEGEGDGGSVRGHVMTRRQTGSNGGSQQLIIVKGFATEVCFFHDEEPGKGKWERGKEGN